MNNSRFEKAIEELRAVRMNPEEKNALHARILERIQAMPATGAVEPVFGMTDPVTGRVASFWNIHSFREWAIKYRMPSIVVAAFMLVILGGGGVAFAAHGSLPGDALYPIKVAVVEPIQGAFFVSPEARVQWEAQLVATRVSEARTLQSKGNFDEHKQEEIRVLVAEHTAAFEVAAKATVSPHILSVAKHEIDDSVALLDGPKDSGKGDGVGKPTVAAGVAADTGVATMSAVSAAHVPSAGSSAKILKTAVTASSSVHTTASTSPASGLALPHIEGIKTVKNLIKETSAVVNAVGGVETVTASTTSHIPR